VKLIVRANTLYLKKVIIKNFLHGLEIQTFRLAIKPFSMETKIWLIIIRKYS